MKKKTGKKNRNKAAGKKSLPQVEPLFSGEEPDLPSGAGSAESDEAVCVFGAGAVLKHLAALEQEAAGLRAGEEDIELIHRARVATRRLRAALPLFEECFKPKTLKKWLKDIRGITRALGAARDADVQIERVQKALEKLKDTSLRPGVERLLVRLRQERERVQPDVAEAIAGFFGKNLIAEMHEALDPMVGRAAEVVIYTPALYRHSCQSIEARLDDFLAYREVIYDVEKVAELHEMRIAAKRLRYTMEAFTPLYSNELKESLQAVRKMQDLLGDVHDCDVWLAFLPEFEASERERTAEYFGSVEPFDKLLPGIEYFRRTRAESRAELYQEAVERWEGWNRANLWDSLLAEIRQPLITPREVYPPLKEE